MVSCLKARSLLTNNTDYRKKNSATSPLRGGEGEKSKHRGIAFAEPSSVHLCRKRETSP